ncbi:MAG TPA: ATPase, T2SS/T4P/T4SS family [Candidatus Syntrophosphaera sp.]|jgi:type IV pilus assembly protein PilB|nr:ATPase, T2SS/T4P/T4SS family [Candidatus Cloacimonadota bacterium]OQB92464.1 MAG: Type II secretion system protein E [Candidatus Cloacimonetes bacterium ADurb.Bin117]HNU53917.1 ATPase, T2SS/T4P/T4SS family [Candidatus Syntrophosphaera sp.]MDI9524848.1 ATPase, T2SS/T4P/T4SS family [Candidatus Cloacimonadota bacterium]NLH93440.1 Flp pilus assembly complex ATPase component TadA [Candidatus Cloacimonadota bacterium]
MNYNPQFAPFGEIVVHEGYATEDQVKEALTKQSNFGLKIGETMVKLGHITEAQLLSVLHMQLDYEIAQESELMEIDLEVVRMIPEPYANQNRVIALREDDDGMVVAMTDPDNLTVLDSLKKILGKNVKPRLISDTALRDTIEKHYKRIRTTSEVEDAVDGFDFVAMDDDENEITISAASGEADAPIVRLLNLIINEAIKSNATDIHIEPLIKNTRVRYRVDGALREVMTPPIGMHPGLISLVKVMSKLNIAERRLPQDGHIALKTSLKSVDVRVSITPTVLGEKVVMRLLDKGEFGFKLNTLGFEQEDMDIFNRIIRRPYGIIIVSGPTGSGKSTSLHAALKEIEDVETNIITVEDPVEYRLEGVTQIETKEQIGLTFGTALRSVLRQDPDIVLIGEIRDEETADIAIKFSLTGHLVFSTLHANDAPSTVTRLIDIGIKPYLVGSSLSLVMAQRLVRKICPYCIMDYKPTDQEISDCGLSPEQAAQINFKIGRGCVHCDNTGFAGRTGIFELLTVNPEIRSIIYDGGNQDLIREAALRAGMRTLHDAAITKMVKGITTIREVIKMTIVE